MRTSNRRWTMATLLCLSGCFGTLFICDRTQAEPSAALEEAANQEATGDETSKPDSESAEVSEKEVPAGHSMHGEAFNEGPRQKAYLMEGMADIDFPITAE